MSIKNLWAGIAFLLLNWTAAAAQGVAQSRAELVAAGDSLLSSYRIFEALGCYEEAWQQYADISAARGLAECHYRRGDYRRCVALLERVATVSEDSLTHTSLRQLVYSYKYFKNTAAELRWGELLLRKYPFDAEMTAEIARVYNMDEVNLPQRANALTKAYCERDSTNLSVLLQLADSYYFQNDYVRALPAYERLLALGDSTYNIYYSIGMCHVRLEQLPEARTYLQRAAEINGHKSTGCLYRLGEVCLALDSLDESIRYLELAVQAMEPDQHVMFLAKRALGEAFYQKGEWWNAIFAWREALKRNQNSLATCFNLAQVYGIVGETELEKTFYRVFLSMAAHEKETEELRKWVEQAVQVVGTAYYKKGSILLPPDL